VVGRARAARHAVHLRLAEPAAEELRRGAHVRLDGAEAGRGDAAVAAPLRGPHLGLQLGLRGLRRGRWGLLPGAGQHLLLGQAHAFDEVGGVDDAGLGGDRLDQRRDGARDRSHVGGQLQGRRGGAGGGRRAVDEDDRAAGDGEGGGPAHERGRHG